MKMETDLVLTQYTFESMIKTPEMFNCEYGISTGVEVYPIYEDRPNRIVKVSLTGKKTVRPWTVRWPNLYMVQPELMKVFNNPTFAYMYMVFLRNGGVLDGSRLCIGFIVGGRNVHILENTWWIIEIRKFYTIYCGC